MSSKLRDLLLKHPTQDQKLCLLVLKSDGMLLEDVIDQNEDVCLTACKQNPNAVNKIRNWEVRAEFVAKYPKYFKYLTRDRKPSNVQILAVKRNPELMSKVDPHIREHLLIHNPHVADIPPKRAWYSTLNLSKYLKGNNKHIFRTRSERSLSQDYSLFV